MVQLVVDCREHALLKELTTPCDVRQLDIGDVHICDDDTIRCVIERKTWSDLEASIYDGRYKEQKARMLASGYPIVYIMETNTTKNEQLVKKAMLHTQVRDRIPTIMSDNIAHTARIVTYLTTKPSDFFTCERTKEYSAIHVKKSLNITTYDIYVAQLALIPGISKSTAKTIQQHYPNMKQLITSFGTCETPGLMLSSIPKIGKVLSKRIFETLCPDT